MVLLLVEEKLKEELLVKLLEDMIVGVSVVLIVGIVLGLGDLGVGGSVVCVVVLWSGAFGAAGALLAVKWDCATCTMDGAGMFTIPGVMSFTDCATVSNLLVALCSHHCGDALVIWSRGVHSVRE